MNVDKMCYYCNSGFDWEWKPNKNVASGFDFFTVGEIKKML